MVRTTGLPVEIITSDSTTGTDAVILVLFHKKLFSEELNMKISLNINTDASEEFAYLQIQCIEKQRSLIPN